MTKKKLNEHELDNVAGGLSCGIEGGFKMDGNNTLKPLNNNTIKVVNPSHIKGDIKNTDSNDN